MVKESVGGCEGKAGPMYVRARVHIPHNSFFKYFHMPRLPRRRYVQTCMNFLIANGRMRAGICVGDSRLGPWTN
jgi:hypothetical protein